MSLGFHPLSSTWRHCCAASTLLRLADTALPWCWWLMRFKQCLIPSSQPFEPPFSLSSGFPSPLAKCRHFAMINGPVKKILWSSFCWIQISSANWSWDGTLSLVVLCARRGVPFHLLLPQAFMLEPESKPSSGQCWRPAAWRSPVASNPSFCARQGSWAFGW